MIETSTTGFLPVQAVTRRRTASRIASRSLASSRSPPAIVSALLFAAFYLNYHYGWISPHNAATRP